MSISVVRLDYQDVLWIWCVFFISDCQVWGWCSHQWRLEMTLAGFNLLRVALFATRIFVWVQMAFPRVNKEISRRKSRWKLTIITRLRSANLHSLTVYFAMLKKNYVVMIVILVWMVSGVEKSIKPPQRCYLCVVSDVLFTLCSIRHCLLFVINLLSDREEWGVNVYDGESPRRLIFT